MCVATCRAVLLVAVSAALCRGAGVQNGTIVAFPPLLTPPPAWLSAQRRYGVHDVRCQRHTGWLLVRWDEHVALPIHMGQAVQGVLVEACPVAAGGVCSEHALALQQGGVVPLTHDGGHLVRVWLMVANSTGHVERKFPSERVPIGARVDHSRLPRHSATPALWQALSETVHTLHWAQAHLHVSHGGTEALHAAFASLLGDVADTCALLGRVAHSNDTVPSAPDAVHADELTVQRVLNMDASLLRTLTAGHTLQPPLAVLFFSQALGLARRTEELRRAMQGQASGAVHQAQAGTPWDAATMMETAYDYASGFGGGGPWEAPGRRHSRTTCCNHECCEECCGYVCYLACCCCCWRGV